MEVKTFEDLMCREHLDRLDGSVMLFCERLEEDMDYHNIDIAYALVVISLRRIKREGVSVQENFAMKLKELAEGHLKTYAEFWEDVADYTVKAGKH